MACAVCGLHRPGLNADGVCPSCIRFNKDLPPQVAVDIGSKVSAPLNGRVESRCRNCRKLSAEVSKRGECPTCLGITRCPRCGGSGRISQYSHISAGQCFLCGGRGRTGGGRILPPRSVPTAENLAFASRFIAARDALPFRRAPQGVTQSIPELATLPKPDKARVIDAALGDELTFEQLRAVLDNAKRYELTGEERELLGYCMDQTRPEPVPIAVIEHSAEDWWSRSR